MDEASLVHLFSEFGTLLDLTVIRDRTTNLHKGCAFVVFASRNSADTCVEQLHEKVKLSGAPNLLQVRTAENSSDKEHKVFVGMLPKIISEMMLAKLFQPFGDISEIHMIKGPDRQFKGCAFIKFVDRESARTAIDLLHNTIPEGSHRPLVVKFAEMKGIKTSPTAQQATQLQQFQHQNGE